MIITKKIEGRRLYQYTKKNGWFLFISCILAVLSTFLIDTSHFEPFSLPAGIIGTALAFLIGFRNNTAYDRWWEARKIWGKLVNDSRYFALQITSYIDKKNSTSVANVSVHHHLEKILYRHMAFVWSLNKHLRRISWHQTLEPFLEKDELSSIKEKTHVPFALLKIQTEEIKALYDQNYFDDNKHVSLINTMENFNDALGKSERIKNTVFPMQYNWYMQYALWVFLGILPFSMVSQFGFWTFPISMIVGYIFILLEYLGRQIENPFENHPSDTPIDSLSRTIEINLKEALGETDLPSKIEPLNGKFLF